MFKVRVIPCLDVKDGRVVKGVNFVDLRDAGQFSVGAADSHVVAVDDSRAGAVIGMDQDFGALTHKIELSIQLLPLPARHKHQWRGRLKGGKLIEGRRPVSESALSDMSADLAELVPTA